MAFPPLNSRRLRSKWTLGFLPNWPETPVTSSKNTMQPWLMWGSRVNPKRKRTKNPPSCASICLGETNPHLQPKNVWQCSSSVREGCVTPLEEKFLGGPPIVIVTLAGWSVYTSSTTWAAALRILFHPDRRIALWSLGVKILALRELLLIGSYFYYYSWIFPHHATIGGLRRVFFDGVTLIVIFWILYS